MGVGMVGEKEWIFVEGGLSFLGGVMAPSWHIPDAVLLRYGMRGKKFHVSFFERKNRLLVKTKTTFQVIGVQKNRSAKEVSLSPKSRGCLAHARVFLGASDLNENKFPSEIIRGKVRKSRVIPPTPLGPPSVPTRAGCTPHESRAPPVTCEGSSAISHLRHTETFLAHPLPLRTVRETEWKSNKVAFYFAFVHRSAPPIMQNRLVLLATNGNIFLPLLAFSINRMCYSSGM
ncbi:hypothetical protein TNIN_334831 [Trichonephila inaurata madagascariensis]|uniref:Uncharacterized protein n=1 Tax=Trichonephila inaurata madagascariensis TaxID=2747483 RepID=A0A8X7BSX1_9ARAC|nr:hypothetical protein TNIN_334831 [Trichonephila inaurata madagascariensis]